MVMGFPVNTFKMENFGSQQGNAGGRSRQLRLIELYVKNSCCSIRSHGCLEPERTHGP